MPDGSIDPDRNYVAELSTATSSHWPTIAAAHDNAVECQKFLFENLRTYINDDHDIIVFGSLARREWTSDSDVDWTLLIDGAANSDHRIVGREIEQALGQLTFQGTDLKPPGAEGIFGNMAFSHEIVHHIGGQADTNRNTTQRILLLLEAAALKAPDDDKDDGPFERILRQILNRYLLSDSNFHAKADAHSRIPRFLLNDIVRYWRTMCVDFAYKEWEQAGKKWALRNIKLRTSRKLLFVAGLLTVFSCFQNDTLRRQDSEGDTDYLLRVQSHLLTFVHSTPLNIIVWALQGIGLDDPCAELVGEYEQFLAKMNNTADRNHLAGLSEQDVYDDGQFLECRDISHRLQSALKKVCFELDSPLREFTCEYGVF